MCDRILSPRQSAINRALSNLCIGDRETLGRLAETMLSGILRDEAHAIEVCRLCDPVICTDCPVDSEIMSREMEALTPEPDV